MLGASGGQLPFIYSTLAHSQKLIITELKQKAASHSGASADPILFTIYLFHGRSSLECRHPHYHVSFLAFFSRQSTCQDSLIESSQTQTSDYHPAIRTLIFITIELHFGSISNTGQSHLSLVISERNCKNIFYILGILRRDKNWRGARVHGQREGYLHDLVRASSDTHIHSLY